MHNFYFMASSSFGWPFFGLFAEACPDALSQLRKALSTAEAEVMVCDCEAERERKEDLLENIRAKVEEFENQTHKDLKVEIHRAMHGEAVAQLRLQPSDTVAQVCEAVLRETGEEFLVAHKLVFRDSVLPNHCSLESCGVRSGDALGLTKAPMECLTVSHDGSARLFGLRQEATGSSEDSSNEAPKVFCPGGALLTASLSSCRARLLTISADGSGQLWCVESGERLHELSGGACSGCFSPDGKLVAGVDVDGNGAIWSVETGEVLGRMPAPGISPRKVGDDETDDEDDEISLVLFSASGETVLTVAGCCVQLWRVSSKQLQPLQTLHGHTGAVKAADFSPDGKLLLTAAADGTARLWSCSTGACLQVLRGHGRPLSSCEFAPNQQQFLTTSQDGTCRIWQLREDLSESIAECLFTLDAEHGVVNSARFSPDGRHVLLAAGCSTAKMFRSDCGDLEVEFDHGHTDWVRSAGFSPDGQIVVTASYDGSACLWSATSGRSLASLVGHSQAVIAADLLAN